MRPAWGFRVEPFAVALVSDFLAVLFGKSETPTTGGLLRPALRIGVGRVYKDAYPDGNPDAMLF
jgi:hypothetical protein